jgi:hypothetical protein
MRDFQRSIRGWFGMINNSTPAETKTKTFIDPPQPGEEQPVTPPVIEKLDLIIDELEVVKEEVKEYKKKKNINGEEVQQ